MSYPYSSSWLIEYNKATSCDQSTVFRGIRNARNGYVSRCSRALRHATVMDRPSLFAGSSGWKPLPVFVTSRMVKGWCVNGGLQWHRRLRKSTNPHEPSFPGCAAFLERLEKVNTHGLGNNQLQTGILFTIETDQAFDHSNHLLLHHLSPPWWKRIHIGSPGAETSTKEVDKKEEDGRRRGPQKPKNTSN